MKTNVYINIDVYIYIYIYADSRDSWYHTGCIEEKEEKPVFSTPVFIKETRR